MKYKDSADSESGHRLKRREFLATLTACTVGLMIPDLLNGEVSDSLNGMKDRLGTLLPHRKLGSSGAVVTNLGLGGGHITGLPDKEAQAMIEKALEVGIRFFDNAELYGAGRSEEHYGKFLSPKYRDISFIMTKTQARDRASALKDLEGSLSRMKLDYVDLWQIHAIDSPWDVERRIENGVLDALVEAQESGKVKHLGFTGHTSYKAHMKMIEEAEARGVKFAAAQMPVNPADPHFDSFIINVVPKCIEAGIGVLAMKTVADGRFWGGNSGWKRKNVNVPPAIPDAVTLEEVFSYVWSLPVSCLISGMDKVRHVIENSTLARNELNISEEQRQQIVDALAPFAGQDLEFYKN